ncbi:unnamed protein product, partial [Discosporangium mesarthrocarpum]
MSASSPPPLGFCPYFTQFSTPPPLQRVRGACCRRPLSSHDTWNHLSLSCACLWREGAGQHDEVDFVGCLAPSGEEITHLLCWLSEVQQILPVRVAHWEEAEGARANYRWWRCCRSRMAY